MHSLHASASGGLFLFFLDFHGFNVLGFEDLAAVQTFHVVYAVSSGDDLGAGMLAGGLHKQRLDEMRFILAGGCAMSSPLLRLTPRRALQFW
jgi:hypothetical protein